MFTEEQSERLSEGVEDKEGTTPTATDVGEMKMLHGYGMI